MRPKCALAPGSRSCCPLHCCPRRARQAPIALPSLASVCLSLSNSPFAHPPHPSPPMRVKSSLKADFTACFCRSWNPGCSDTINSVAYYINLLQGSMSTAINRGSAGEAYNATEACGGRCDESQGEICRSNGQCGYPECQDVVPYCNQSSNEGLRARQICPETCGCDRPRSPLALFLPESGCPARCRESTTYRAALAATPCEDVPLNDSNFTGFLEQWYQAAQTWPKDWLESGIGFIDMFQLFGCEYLNMNPEDLPENFSSTQYVLDRPLRNFSGWPGPNLFWPANFGVGVNPCVTNGYYYPVKPLSFFCPVSCGCRAGDIGCPDTCRARFESDATNADGQVDHSGLEPNPSPRNVPNFPWRYS